MVLSHWKTFGEAFKNTRLLHEEWRMVENAHVLSRRYLEKDQQKVCDLSSNSLFSAVFKRLNCFCLSCLFLEISCSKQKPAFHLIFLLMPQKTQHWNSLKKSKTLSKSAIWPAVTFQCRIKSHCLLIVLCWKLKVLVSSTKHFGAFKRKVKSFLTSRGSTLKYITFHLKGKKGQGDTLNTLYGLYSFTHIFVTISLSCIWFEKGTC